MTLANIIEDLIDFGISGDCLRDLIFLTENELQFKKSQRRNVDKNIKLAIKKQKELNSGKTGKELKDDLFAGWTDDNLFSDKVKTAIRLNSLLNKRNKLISDIKDLSSNSK